VRSKFTKKCLPSVFPDLLAGLGKGLSGLLYAVLLIAAMVAMPRGIVGMLAAISRRIRPVSRPAQDLN
jgi:hypothetical protein